MFEPCSITGIGLVTPLGSDVGSTFSAMLEGRFISSHSRAAVDVLVRGSRLTGIAGKAAREAVKDAGWDATKLSDAGTGLVVATSKGPIEDWIGERGVYGGGAYGLGSLSGEIGKRLGLGMGPRITMSSACATGLHGIIRAGMMLDSGEADRVLIVAAESSLHPIFTGSFARLGVTSRSGACRPFDENRDGFLMSEAAAAICVERVHNVNRYPRIARAAMSADAMHLTGSDPVARGLTRTLKDVIDGEQIDLVHAHGTGTELNDPIELMALRNALADGNNPVVFSHKGAMGHSLGAAGLVAVVLSMMMHHYGLVPGNVLTERPIDGGGLRILREDQQMSIARSIVVAAGFGGAIAAIGLE